MSQLKILNWSVSRIRWSNDVRVARNSRNWNWQVVLEIGWDNILNICFKIGVDRMLRFKFRRLKIERWRNSGKLVTCSYDISW